MCKEDNNNKKKNDNNNNAASSATTANNDDTTTAAAAAAGAAAVAAGEADVSSSDNSHSPRHRRHWLCCYRESAMNGTELGVWIKSLEDQAGWLMQWTLGYLTPLLMVGSHKVLDENDMGIPSREDQADIASYKALIAWNEQSMKANEMNRKRREIYEEKIRNCGTNEEKRRKIKEPVVVEPSVAIALLNAFGLSKVIMVEIYYIIGALLSFAPVLILNDLVRYFESGLNAEEYVGLAHPWFLVIMLFIVPFLITMLQTRQSVVMAHCSVFVRTAVSTLLFRKTLTISGAGRSITSTGQVVNMMSNDTAQLQRFLQFSGMTITAPIQIIIALILIYRQVGNATWVGIAFMIFLAPLNTMVFDIVSNQRRKVLKFADLRVKMMNEILAGIRIIKFYAWERPFGNEVSKLRTAEMKALTMLAYTSAIGFSLILLAAPLIQPILVFLTYVSIQDKPLDAATAFTTVALFNIMRFPFAFLPMGFLQYLQSRISLKRLERYLDLPELSHYVIDSPPPPAEDEEYYNETDIMKTTTTTKPSGNNNKNSMLTSSSSLSWTRESECQDGSVTIRSGTFSWVDPDAAPIRPISEAPKNRKQRKQERIEKRKSDIEAKMKSKKKNGSTGRRDHEGGGIASSPPAEASGESNNNNGSSAIMVASAHGSEGGLSSSSSMGKIPRITLQDLNFHIPSGSLVAVVGPVGCGKSSLLSAILGELEPIDDSKVYIPKPKSSDSGTTNTTGNYYHDNDVEDVTGTPGYISYCTQTPWVVNDTLRGNILFGRPYHEDRYQCIIEACALSADLTVLPAGDMTEIGERGINLSGGQKARVSLARAMYSVGTKLILMDDPLSAVDAHVGEHIFTNAINGVLTTGITRILVTHHVHLLPKCDSVMVLEHGKIAHYGTYEDLIKAGVDFTGAVDVSKLNNNKDNDKDDNNDDDKNDDDKDADDDKNKLAEQEGGGVGGEDDLKIGDDNGVDSGSGDNVDGTSTSETTPSTDGVVVSGETTTTAITSSATSTTTSDAAGTSVPPSSTPSPTAQEDVMNKEPKNGEGNTTTSITTEGGGGGGEDRKPDGHGSNKSSSDGAAAISKETSKDVSKDAIAKGKKLVKAEEREEGNIAGSAYYHYGSAGGLWMVVFVILIQGLGRGGEIMASFWLALWADNAAEAAQSKAKTNYYVGMYAVFGITGVLGLVFRSLAIAVHRLRASTKLHNDLTESILRAPVAFYDVTPTGRILNRFAADMDKVDLELTQSLSQGLSTLFSVLGAVSAIIVATKGTFLIPMIPLSFIYYEIQKWFRKTSTELQRINSIANSPIFADFSQTLSGTSTIRAYGEQSRFFTQCRKSFDIMNASFVLVQLTNFWLGLRLDILGGCLGAFIGGVAVATHSSGFIPAGWLGLALSYSIEITNFLKHGVRMIASIEAQMSSVERILYYTNNITPEAPEYMPGIDPDPSAGDVWPSDGVIDFTNASMRYRDGPLVLKNLNVHIKRGEKIGVCGRTGSGKSSLMIALFRISEIENDGGRISIDGIDTKTIGTAALRLNLSIIPQDPIIFSNTVRYNVDPFDQSSDEELWDVLRKVQMYDVIASLDGQLAFQVAEGGENFSQGQKQLLCIARALLRRPKVLVLDEATASIDNSTDAIIQKMIRENFVDATVLTIAHRLNTIMDSDRILVLDDGNVVEYDTPENLLKKDPDTGVFRGMVEKSRNAQEGGGGME